MFQKQDVMRRVVYALIPMFLFATVLYGWRVPITTAVVFIFGIATEYVFERSRKKKVSEAVLVTCMLYSLSLPPVVPLWIAVVGIIFAVAIGKEVYGGFGRNIFNPAITGRLFIYIAFPTVLTTAWMVPALMSAQNAIVGAFGSAGVIRVDALSAATPLAVIRSGELPNLLHLFIGFRSGSFGESSTLLILAAGAYLMATKTANWRMIVSTFLSALFFAVVFYFNGIIPGLNPGAYAGIGHLAPIAAYLMSGSILFVAVFMATDPISAPNKPLAQFIYGVLIGGVSIIVRVFSGFPEGTSFGILIANTFASLIDELVPKPKKKAKSTKEVTA